MVLANPILSAHGSLADMEIYEDKIAIRPRGFIMGRRGDKEIQIRQISAIQFRKPGFMAAGFIQFSFVGGQEKNTLAFDPEDENAVMFDSAHLEEFERAKELIEQLMEKSRTSTQTAAAVDIPTQIKKLAELRDAGILTENEFESKKAELLARL